MASDRRSGTIGVAVGTAFAVTLLLVLCWPLAQQARVQDLHVYRDAGQAVLDGRALFPPASSYPSGPGSVLPFTYPPFAALLFIPLTWFPVSVDVLVWWALSLLALGYLVRRGFATLLASVSPVSGWTLTILVMGVSLWIAPVTYVLLFGQVGLFLAALCMVDLRIAARGSRFAGVLVGLSTAVKLQPAAFIATLWMARGRRAAIVATATIAVAWGLAALVLPSDTRDWTGVAGDASRIGPLDWPINITWQGEVLRTWGPGTTSTLLALCLSVTTLVIAVVRGGRLLRAGSPTTAAVVVGAGAVVASPVAWPHHAVWIVPAVGIIIGTGRSLRRWVLSLALAVTFSVPAMPWVQASLMPLAGVVDWVWVSAGPIALTILALTLRPDPRAPRETEVQAPTHDPESHGATVVA